MSQTPTTEPTVIHAGDTVRWTKSLKDHPATMGWTLVYTLINATQKITLNAIASGADYLIEAPASTTQSWAAGEYDWRATVNKSGDVYTVGDGRIRIKTSFAFQTLDGRSPARKALEAVESYLYNSANLAAAEYEIQGRKLKRFSIPELWAHRDRLRTEVSKEETAREIAKGLPDPRRIYVRFGA